MRSRFALAPFFLPRHMTSKKSLPRKERGYIAVFIRSDIACFPGSKSVSTASPEERPPENVEGCFDTGAI